MTQKLCFAVATTALTLALTPTVAQAQAQSVRGWLSWRGPHQNGTSMEKDLPSKVSETGEKSWTFKVQGRGTPVIAGGRVYTMGYEGAGSDLEEMIVCLDEHTGKKVWDHRFTDFISDTIYYRYAIGSPTIDPETGNVLCMSTAGLLNCFTAGGKLLWQKSLMSEYGRLSFPNGRTGAPLVTGQLCIVHIINSGWGTQAPARDRFFAFDKKTGESVWSCTPGGPPKDSSFCMPYVAIENGKRVLYAGLGGGNIVCVNVLTGDPIWRFRLATGGVNSSPLLYKNSLIVIHGKENMDDSKIGRMIAIKRGAQPEDPRKGPVELSIKEHELWRNDLVAFTSSPVLVGNRVYQTTAHGELCCVDADTGKIHWEHELATDQLHASPAWGDDKLYVPMNNGKFFILSVNDKGYKVLHEMQLAGNCLGAPAIANGRIYVHTTEKLYSFAGGTGKLPPTPLIGPEPAVGEATRLQVLPADLVIPTGKSVDFRVRSLDANGRVVSENVRNVTWDGVPGNGITIDENGVLKTASNATPMAGVLNVSADGLSGSARLRVVPGTSYTDDFENATLKMNARKQAMTAPHRAHWVGAKLKWEIRELNGDKVLAKTIDRPLFQRTMTLIGQPSMSNYTVQCDIYSDGNRRTMSSAGVVNQRYLIVLKGNHQALEISSNMELLKKSVRFKWKPKKWYRLKTRVDVAADGSGVVRAKVWLRGEKEPDKWTIEVPHSHAHKQGSPGIYGFVPQSRFRVYIDNLSVTKND